MRTVTTDRLILVPSTANILQAEMEDRDRLAFLLGAQIPYNWPMDEYLEVIPIFLEALRIDPPPLGWQSWYWLKKEASPEKPTLIGGGGFLGEPDLAGSVEIGYSVLPQYRRLGYATEGARGLITWAMTHPQVRRIVAETEPSNEHSVRILTKLGFFPCVEAARPGMSRFELHRA
jgi:[ribosomal protein S5]-alanine N-acetyltransferase